MATIHSQLNGIIRVLSGSPKLSYLPINSLVLLLFIFINPIYALPISTAIIIFSTNKLNPFLAGFLFSISFTLLFLFQDGLNVEGNDVYVYISIYEQIDKYSFSYLFERFILNVRGNEFFWYAYNKIISNITGNDNTVFVFTSYFIMFSLAAYLTFLVSGNNNYLFFLFILIYFQMTFQFTTYLLWRHTFASLLFFIGITLFNKGYSYIMPRVLMYSSPLFHVVTIPMVIFFELFNIIYNYKYYTINKINNKLLLFIFKALVILLLIIIFNDFIMTKLRNIGSFEMGLKEYNVNYVTISYKSLLHPVSILLTVYMIFSKKIRYYELFIFFIFYTIIFLPLINILVPESLIGRTSAALNIIALLIGAKVIVRSGYSGFIILLLIFVYRQYTFIEPKFIHHLSSVGNGNYLNPFYGIFNMLLFYEPPTY
jgi:hypothetical protein